eukprot:5645151-Lingulodinium_polyedra.AAC.1
MSLVGLGQGEGFAGSEGFAAPRVHLHQLRQHRKGGEEPARRQVDVMDAAQWHCSASAGWIWRAWAIP